MAAIIVPSLRRVQVAAREERRQIRMIRAARRYLARAAGEKGDSYHKTAHGLLREAAEDWIRADLNDDL